MRTRGATGILIGLVVMLLSACGKQGCTTLPVTSGIHVQVPPAIRRIAHDLRVGLCQGNHCKAVEFRARASDATGTIAPGIVLDKDTFDIDLARLGSGWKAATPSELTITGTTKRGRTVLHHTEQFTFAAAYPNGTDCDDSPALTYGTSVGGEDLV